MDIRAGFFLPKLSTTKSGFVNPLLCESSSFFLPPDPHFSYHRTKDLVSCFAAVEGSISVIANCILLFDICCKAGLMYLLREQLA